MNFYWVYDLPTVLFGFLSVTAFIAIGLLALFPTRKWVKRQHRSDKNHNDVVSYYLAAITVFYGITLGLLAVGTWTTYSSVQDKVNKEAETLNSLFRDVSSYPQPLRQTLQQNLKDYTYQVVTVSWPLQQRGIVPPNNVFLTHFQQNLVSFEPTTSGQQIIHTEAYKQFNELVEDRRSRINSVETGMPASLWAMVIIGGLITIAVTIFFDIASLRLHIWMTIMVSGLLGLMIFLIATLDNPYRGSVSVGPDALIRVYNQLIAPTTHSPLLPEHKL